MHTCIYVYIKNTFTPPVPTQYHRKAFSLPKFIPPFSGSEKCGCHYSPHISLLPTLMCDLSHSAPPSLGPIGLLPCFAT